MIPRAEMMRLGVVLTGLLAMVVAKSFAAGHITHMWLGWNVFLAMVPWGASIFAEGARKRGSLAVAVSMIAVWFLFFPNAPYIVTDLVHMPKANYALWWYDQAILVVGVVAGLMLTWYSWDRIRTLMTGMIGRKWSTAFAYTMLYLAAFGVYLGRFSRWNSWDILAAPQHLIVDVASRFINPTLHPRTWAFTGVFGTLLVVGAWLLRDYPRRIETRS